MHSSLTLLFQECHCLSCACYKIARILVQTVTGTWLKAKNGLFNYVHFKQFTKSIRNVVSVFILRQKSLKRNHYISACKAGYSRKQE